MKSCANVRSAIGLSYMPIASQNLCNNLKIKAMVNEFMPMVQVRTNEVLFFDMWMGTRKANETSWNPFENPVQQNQTYSGQMTHGAEKRMRKAVSLLLQLSPTKIIYNPVIDCHHPFSINFITLTCSAEYVVSHSELYKKCMRPYLDWQRRQGAEHYIWKVELQKRGQPHYHITTNQFIHYQQIRQKWNSLQRKAGYLDDYARKHRHYDANSTDVHSVRNVKDIEAYLIKYLSKDPDQSGQSKVIKGKIWDCSASLKKSYFTTFATGENVKSAKKLAKKYIALERCAVARSVKPERVLENWQIQEYRNYISSL